MTRVLLLGYDPEVRVLRERARVVAVPGEGGLPAERVDLVGEIEPEEGSGERTLEADAVGFEGTAGGDDGHGSPPVAERVCPRAVPL